MLDPFPSRCVYIRLPIHVIHLWVLLEKCAYGENGKAHVEAVALPVLFRLCFCCCFVLPIHTSVCAYSVPVPANTYGSGVSTGPGMRGVDVIANRWPRLLVRATVYGSV